MLKVAKIKLLWRQGWVEIPELMAGAGIAFLGMGLSLYGYLRKENNEGWSHKYMSRPLVIRPDDPRVPKIQTYSNLD